MATLQETKQTLQAALSQPNGLTVMLWGPPGIGKTSCVMQAAQELGVGIKSVIAHLYQPVDVLGLPFVVDGRCEYAPPAVFPDPERDGERGIFFIDELPNCVPAMQSAWGIVILERSTRHFSFPPGWRVVCAGNREGDRAGSARLISALENRLVHVEVTPSADEFLRYGLSRGFHSAVLAFIEERRDLLVKFDPRSAERAFPSPRSWERVSEILALALPAQTTQELLRGVLGAGAATEFGAFLQVQSELPPLAALLRGEIALQQFQGRPDILRAAVYSVLSYAAEGQDASRVEEALQVAMRAPDEWAVLMLKRLQQHSPALLLKATSWREVLRRYGKYVS
jgi:MoxR-like ATPase